MENKISILCYTLKDNLIDKLLLLEDDGYIRTIELDSKDEEHALLHSGKIFLEEEFQIVPEYSKWKYLGEIKFGKRSHVTYCFAVDVSDLQIETLKKFNINLIPKIKDSVCLSSFFKLFSLLYKNVLR